MNIAQKINSVSKLKGEFKLRSGKISNTYFDKYQFEANPELLKAIAIEMKDLVPNDCDVLAGLEMGGIPVVTMLSQVTGIPAAFIRKEPKEYGTFRYAEGTNLHNKNVVIVEDVVSSGGAIIEAVNRMRNDGLEVNIAICVIDRESGGKEKLKANGIELKSLLTKSEIENTSNI